MNIIKIYPKVFKSNQTQKIYFRTDMPSAFFQIMVQGMEYYTVPHTPIYRIDEESRYVYMPMKKEEDGLFSFEYSFCQEQKYRVKIKCGDEIVFSTYVYAVDEDLLSLRPYKGDTHLHTNGSDGAYPPFETACYYREAGFDFIAVTDHHKLYPSREAKAAVEALTDLFTVFIGEEVHNRDMGYIHIINFGGENSVNIPILSEPDKVEKEGITIPVVGASDCHDVKNKNSLFDRQFTIVFAEKAEDIKSAIMQERSVAVLKRNEREFFVFGKFRYVKYARFILEEYAPTHNKLAKNHAEALLLAGVDGNGRTNEIEDSERAILAYESEFFVG